MSGVVLVDLSFGDCGKGRIVDYLSKDFDVVAKYNGGPNSGRTVFIGDKKFVFRLIPSGILNPHVTCLMGQGMVLDPLVLKSEIEVLEKENISVKDRLFVSDSAHVIMPYHIATDKSREVGSNKIGTTKKGIGPCYEDKVARRGIRVQDLYTIPDYVIRNNHNYWKAQDITGDNIWDLDSTFEYFDKAKEIFKPYILNVSAYVNTALKQNKKVLFEGAQGTFLDIDHGTYPYVTSSSTIAGGACTGIGIGPTKINRVIGVSKAYVTRVGDGPFATELLGEQDALASLLRAKGKEFGSVTGRPRRVGWLDLVDMKYACMINGATDLMITKIDVLSHLGLDKFFVRTSSGMKEVPGWQEDISQARSLNELPKNVRSYLDLIEEETETPISLVSVGAERDSMIVLKEVV
jgi:adenylosuccinate synthase